MDPPILLRYQARLCVLFSSLLKCLFMLFFGRCNKKKFLEVYGGTRKFTAVHVITMYNLFKASDIHDAIYLPLLGRL